MLLETGIQMNRVVSLLRLNVQRKHLNHHRRHRHRGPGFDSTLSYASTALAD